MKLFSYVVARDYGFAPNPFGSYCTLATCKPEIRKSANMGDWVLGTGSNTNSRANHIVFAMRVTETLTFNEYWEDARFRQKRPNLRGSKKQAFGDNIYHRESVSEQWIQENSHHSYSDGTPNHENITTDTKYDRVLISNDFMYWGGEGPEIPSRFLDSKENDFRKKGPYHRCNFPDSLVQNVVNWLRNLGEHGYVGEPFDWQRTQ